MSDDESIIRDTIFAGLTDRQLVEAVGMEIHRRGCMGVCYFFLPAVGAAAQYVCIGTEEMVEKKPAETLITFAVIASQSRMDGGEKVDA